MPVKQGTDISLQTVERHGHTKVYTYGLPQKPHKNIYRPVEVTGRIMFLLFAFRSGRKARADIYAGM